MTRTTQKLIPKTINQRLVQAVQCVNQFYTWDWLETKSQITLLRLMAPDDRMYWLKKMGYGLSEIKKLSFFREKIIRD